MLRCRVQSIAHTVAKECADSHYDHHLMRVCFDGWKAAVVKTRKLQGLVPLWERRAANAKAATGGKRPSGQSVSSGPLPSSGRIVARPGGYSGAPSAATSVSGNSGALLVPVPTKPGQAPRRRSNSNSNSVGDGDDDVIAAPGTVASLSTIDRLSAPRSRAGSGQAPALINRLEVASDAASVVALSNV